MNTDGTTFTFGNFFEDIKHDINLLSKKDIQLRVGNTGNEVISVYTLKPLDIRFIKKYPEYEESNEDDNFLYVTANLIRNSCKDVCARHLDRFKKLKSRITVVSLGAQATLEEMKNPKEFASNLLPEIKEFLKLISSRSISIGVRGEFTYDVLRAVGIKNVDLIGCSSWFVNGYNQPEIIKKEWRKSLKPVVYTCWENYTPWNMYWNNALLRNALKLNDPKFVIQSEFNLMPYYLVNKNLKDFIKYYTFRDLINSINSIKNIYGLKYSEILFNKKVRDLFEIFLDIDKWGEFMKTRDFAYGMRIHGSVVAIKQGIPAITVVPDSRILEMSEFFKIPYIRVDQMDSKSFNIQKIYEEADFSEMNKIYPKLLENYITFLNKNGIKHKFVRQENNKEEELINK